MSQVLSHVTVTPPYNQEKVVEDTRTNDVIKYDYGMLVLWFNIYILE